MADLAGTFFLAIPAFIANMAPVVASRLDWFSSMNKPLDAGKKFRDKRIFGENKTLRGLVFGTACAMFTTIIQFLLIKNGFLHFFFFSDISTSLLFGFLGGFGALLGDAVESFFKRQLDIASGRPFIPFDQIDYVLGFTLLTSFVLNWTTAQIIPLLVFAAFANPLINLTAYFLGIKKTYW